MYTSVNVVPHYRNPHDAQFSKGKTPENITQGTAEVSYGVSYIYVSIGKLGKLAFELIKGNTYRITGSGGLNLVGTYVGQSEEPATHYRFKLGD